MAEVGIPYTLTSPTGRAVFGGDGAELDGDYIGRLDGENGITGILNPAPPRLGGGPLPGGDGGYDSGGLKGPRAGTMQGLIALDGTGMIGVNQRVDKLFAACEAYSVDAVLSWQPSSLFDSGELIPDPGCTTYVGWSNGFNSSMSDQSCGAPGTPGSSVADATAPGGSGKAVRFTTAAGSFGQGVAYGPMIFDGGRDTTFSFAVKTAGQYEWYLFHEVAVPGFFTIGASGSSAGNFYNATATGPDGNGWDAHTATFEPQAGGRWFFMIYADDPSVMISLTNVHARQTGSRRRMLRCRVMTEPQIGGRRPKTWQIALRSRDAYLLDAAPWIAGATFSGGTATPMVPANTPEGVGAAIPQTELAVRWANTASTDSLTFGPNLKLTVAATADRIVHVNTDTGRVWRTDPTSVATGIVDRPEWIDRTVTPNFAALAGNMNPGFNDYTINPYGTSYPVTSTHGSTTDRAYVIQRRRWRV